MTNVRDNQRPRIRVMGPGGGPRGFRGAVEKPKDFWGTFKRLMGYLKPYRVKLTLVVVLAIGSTAFAIYAPRISGNAVNEITNGFVAKALVSEISKMQEQYVPAIKDMLDKLNSAEEQAVEKAQAEVKKEFEQKIADEKQKAIEQAQAQAKQMITSNPPQALIAAEQQAEARVKQEFDARIAQEKEKAYAQAEDQVKEQLSKNPPPELVVAEQKAIAEAQAAAKQQVDQEFETKYPGIPPENIPGYSDVLKAAQEQAAQQAKAQVDAAFLQQAISQAKAQVDASFAAQKLQLDAQLVEAQRQAKAQVDAAFLAQALAQAREQVEKAFASRQPELDAQLSKAQQDVTETVKNQARSSFLESLKITPEQLSAMEKLAALPVVNTIEDYGKRADTIEEIMDLSKDIPASETIAGNKMQQFKISQVDITRSINIVRENGGSISFTALGKILLELLLFYFFSALLLFLVQYLMSDIAQNTTYSIREALYNKLTVLPLRYYDTHTAGEIMSRMTNDLDTVSMTLQQTMTQFIRSATEIVGYIYMMLTISGKLTLITLGTLPLYVAVMAFIIQKSQRFFLAQQLHLGKLSSHAEEMFTGHNVVKAFSHEKEAIEVFEDVNRNLYDANWKAQFISGIMMPLTNFISNIAYVFIAVFGGIYVTKNFLNLGDITAFIQYSRLFSQPIVQIANISNVLQSTMACAERVFAVLDEEEETPDPEDAVVLENPRGEIKFDHVTFSYSEDKPLFNDLNLDVKEGDTIAIVGPTGAGKTTLVNLLMRFYDVQKGKITFDGIDIRRIRRGDLRTKFGMVLQDTWLFNGTIRENIAYGRENATEEEIVAAAKAAYADHFIRSLPEGYDTVINEDATNISAGEKQLLTIARAFLANPTVLILDEATSSVDTRTEVLIQKAMSTLMKGRTNFVIAHRLSTIRDAKNILVVDHGRIVEQGTHTELLAKKGFYADLYYSQFSNEEMSTSAG